LKLKHSQKTKDLSVITTRGTVTVGLLICGMSVFTDTHVML
jgi:hypothetical protein